jgi:septal ring factor EnvC (AmiA/AmiB activator)
LLVSGLGHADPEAKEPSADIAQAQDQYQESVQAELKAVNKTQGLLADKLSVRQSEMKARVRAIYKLSRASFPRLWVEPEERRKVAQWLGAARKIATRDQHEIRLLHEEIDIADAAEARLSSIKKERIASVIAPKSLRSPLAKTRVLGAYGEYKGPTRKVRLRRRGLLLKTKPGNEVVAPADGKILYTGPISGLGQAIIIEHEGYSTVVGHAAPSGGKIGDAVTGGAVIGHAEGDKIYLEVRLTIGSVGQTVDPRPLLKR